MTSIHIGAHLERPPGPRYLAELPFAELAIPSPVPKSSTLERWRENLPAGFTVAIVAPPETVNSAAGPLRLGEQDLELGLGWLEDAVEAARPDILVVPTPRAVTPGARDRARLEAYFARLPRREGTQLVWAPTGLWESDDAGRFGEKLGAAVAVDPLVDDVPSGPLAYLRLRALGVRNRFSEGMLIEALEAALGSGADDVYLSLESPRSFKEACRLRDLVVELAGFGEDDELEDDELEDDDE